MKRIYFCCIYYSLGQKLIRKIKNYIIIIGQKKGGKKYGCKRID
ncbi:hypothetical protein ES705_08463 [subsurface metagenome]